MTNNDWKFLAWMFCFMLSLLGYKLMDGGWGYLMIPFITISNLGMMINLLYALGKNES